jgi:hypothetical protein
MKKLMWKREEFLDSLTEFINAANLPKIIKNS